MIRRPTARPAMASPSSRPRPATTATSAANRSRPCNACVSKTIKPGLTCPTCDDGTVVDDQATECKTCWTKTIHRSKLCPTCDDWSKVDDELTDCKTCWKRTIRKDGSCPSCADDGKVVDSTGGDCITCDSKQVRDDTSCYNCSGDGTTSLTGCKQCWNSRFHPSYTCPICGDGKVADRPVDCKTCWDGSTARSDQPCPPKPARCVNAWNGDDAPPGCGCADCGVDPSKTESATEIVYTCPEKPKYGYGEGDGSLKPGKNYKWICTEETCHISCHLVCTVQPVAACYGPGNYCSNPTQVWYDDKENCIGNSPVDCDPSRASSGYVCETTIGF